MPIAGKMDPLAFLQAKGGQRIGSWQAPYSSALDFGEYYVR
jgi:hypothetical protein